jgi:hypothetical protein
MKLVFENFRSDSAQIFNAIDHCPTILHILVSQFQLFGPAEPSSFLDTLLKNQGHCFKVYKITFTISSDFVIISHDFVVESFVYRSYSISERASILLHSHILTVSVLRLSYSFPQVRSPAPAFALRCATTGAGRRGAVRDEPLSAGHAPAIVRGARRATICQRMTIRRPSRSGCGATPSAGCWHCARTDFCSFKFAVQKLEGSLRMLGINFRFVIRTVEC